jgi:hypothetical protein
MTGPEPHGADAHRVHVDNEHVGDARGLQHESIRQFRLGIADGRDELFLR